jgi:hypothetical protein
VHVDDFGHLAEGQRLQELDPLLEEVALPVHDEVHDLEHGLAALLDRLNHPVRAVHLGGDELAVLRRHLLLVAGDLLVGAAEPKPRHAGVVEEHLVAAADLLDNEVGDDVAVVLLGVLEPRLGIQPGQAVGRGLHRRGLHPESLGEVVPAVGDEVRERVVDQTEGQRIDVGLLPELDQQALAQIPGAHPGRIELLDDGQHLLHFGHRVVRRVGGCRGGLRLARLTRLTRLRFLGLLTGRRRGV